MPILVSSGIFCFSSSQQARGTKKVTSHALVHYASNPHRLVGIAHSGGRLGVPQKSLFNIDSFIFLGR